MKKTIYNLQSPTVVAANARITSTCRLLRDARARDAARRHNGSACGKLIPKPMTHDM